MPDLTTIRRATGSTFAALLFACMDGVNKSLVAAYSTAQILWIRYLFLLLFALAVARRRGLRTVISSARVGLQVGRSLLRERLTKNEHPGHT